MEGYRAWTVEPCPECGDIATCGCGLAMCGHHGARARVEVVPVEQLAGAVGALEQARLYGERMVRDPDETVRRCGADLVALIDVERER